MLAGDKQDTCEIDVFVENHPNIHYWLLRCYNCKEVRRDKAFIDQKLLELKEVWDKIVYYRENREAYKKEVVCEIHIDTEPVNVQLPKFAFIEFESC